jgi:hypothetical protein
LYGKGKNFLNVIDIMNQIAFSGTIDDQFKSSTLNQNLHDLMQKHIEKIKQQEGSQLGSPRTQDSGEVEIKHKIELEQRFKDLKKFIKKTKNPIKNILEKLQQIEPEE